MAPADRLCRLACAKTGGMLLPVMWWGALGGHGAFKWTHYQSDAAAGEIIATMTDQLLRFGFRAVALLAGHYPWQTIMDQHLPAIRDKYPQALVLWGTELTINGDEPDLRGDHAAREETSLGLHLLSEFVDMKAMHSGRGDESWPGGRPAIEPIFPGVTSDPNDPLFAQYGEDARTASAEHGKEVSDYLVSKLTERIKRHLGSACG